MRTAERVLFQRLFEMVEEMAGVGCWRVDAATHAVSWSPQVVRIHGLDPRHSHQDIETAISFYHTDDRLKVAAYVQAALTTGEPFSFELRIIRPDGELRRVVSKGAAERDPDGRILSAFGTFMDVTEARRAEEELRSSEARHRLFADNATDMIMLTDLDGRLTYISPSVAKVTGFRPESLVGRLYSELIHRDDVEPLETSRTGLIKSRQQDGAVSVEYRARHRDGRWLWFETRSSLILEPATGQPAGVLDVAREITERKVMEAELRQKRQEAEAATQAKTEFLANMSHEIRTPLTAILGFSAILQTLEGLPPAAEQHLRRITTAGETLLSVVNDVLDVSKLDAGQIELDPQPFDPGDLLRETMDLIAAQASSKALRLELDLADDLPSAALADSARLRQVLINLLGNAVKFTKAGSVRLQARYRRGGGGRLRVAVIDTGPGVPADRRHRLFQRFSQVDSSVSRQYGGTGLGLAICKRLVSLMGGRVGVRSIEGRGSTFWFSVPAPALEALAPRIDPGLDQAVGDCAANAGRVLVVDDVQANRDLALAILSPFGHAMTTAASGREAVALASAEAFDLILMDLQMPGMDGLAAARAIRAEATPNQGTPIVALSANVMPEHLVACHAAGMDDHIAKPINLTELVTKTALWIGRDRRRAASTEARRAQAMRSDGSV